MSGEGERGWLVTFATYHRRPVFANPSLLKACAQALQETIERNQHSAYTLAVMPDHVHVILSAGASGHAAARVLNNLKGVTARRVFQSAPDLKLELKSNHLWADEYQALVLQDEGAVNRACRYVERNPVGLGERIQVYPWLSSRGGQPAGD